MINTDRYYWAALGLLTRPSASAPRLPKTKSTSGLAAEHLDGGCVLFRLPAALNGADIGACAIPDS
jgi:hypothetical protein